jgi:hypothetical protein
MRSSATVTASTMIARWRGCAHGQMSHETVEKKELRAPAARQVASGCVRGSHPSQNTRRMGHPLCW